MAKVYTCLYRIATKFRFFAQKTEYPCGYSVVVLCVRFELKAAYAALRRNGRRPFHFNARGLEFSMIATKKEVPPTGNTSFGPSVEIRTQGLLNPIVACFSFPVQRLQNLDNTDF